MRPILVLCLVLLLFPARAEEPSFDDVIGAVVSVRTEIRADARTRESLGLQRAGSGVLIDGEGLVLTVGYLMMEAEKAWVRTRGGTEVPASVVAYDHESGFGLLRMTEAPDVSPSRLGDSTALEVGTYGIAVSLDRDFEVLPVRVVSRRPYAGQWEFLVERPLHTLPMHPSYGGAALFDRNGTVVGIGALMVPDPIADEPGLPGNLFYPVETLTPVIDDLIATGRAKRPPAPWIGAFAEEHAGRVIVNRVSDGGPADEAGLRPADIITHVGGSPVEGLADLYRKMRALGSAGAEVALVVARGPEGATETLDVVVRSGDRHDWLKLD